ncbi:hypothetical protein HFN08_25345 [Rhizobium leguminosarum]|uniref:hypothetical protein n=1 Tax=Rhizobium leguminosarum TaxID=384 RepID=UPI001032793E|nr:hypothetical protein [Rhizobium leguminosarum]MBY5343654.1 hypothetical protein [Rhizobium leguminosarum]TAY98559.1 hypothetical protein ELH79_08785 [Rhizobium leguminosarum]TAZ09324.1 hypothetical protein ELH78_08785 [Rhizobium leguminosarum]
MRLAKFTYIGTAENPVFINPEQVVSVTPFEKYTEILTTGFGSDGQGKAINVQEDVNRVLALLTV